MTTFIILGLMFTATIGLFCGAVLVGGIPENCGIGRILAILFIAFTIGFGLILFIYHENDTREKDWNNGMCPECKQEWAFVSIDRTRHGDVDYYYTCPNCGKITIQNSMR